METIDWTVLANQVKPRSDRVLYDSHRHLFTKVAFDVFQLNSSPTESLWILEKDENGKEYLAAMYGEENAIQQLEVKSQWDAIADKDCKNITLLYKNTPLQRFASTDYGFNQSDAHVFQKTLILKLSSDKAFREKFLKSQPQEKRDIILKQFPELV